MSISDAIKHDHRELEDYYNKIKSATDDDTKVRYQNQFVWELARHSIAEEIVVYPALEEHVDNGREIADKDRQEHLVVKKRLYKFQKMYPKDAEFIPVLDGLMKTLQGHIKDEEKHDLVALEGGIEGTQSEDLAKSFKRTKLFVPTQSHPSAPDKPPFETVAGLLSAPLDKLMDMFKKFPKD
ncbi:HHE domain-containing protein [Pleurostoma richardsiae]|uniref:HHE domain-containing protein n=1 Tax=Pleurostoma richardsiae TaxID=41990 RepID=A0AA38VSK5_9PEZI|nr:HHE domain-containing protein [Pleurostoma richardsiae]